MIIPAQIGSSQREKTPPQQQKTHTDPAPARLSLSLSPGEIEPGLREVSPRRRAVLAVSSPQLPEGGEAIQVWLAPLSLEPEAVRPPQCGSHGSLEPQVQATVALLLR